MHSSLWAPWRAAYLRDLVAKEQAAGGEGSHGAASGGDGNFLRAAWERPDLDGPNHVVLRATDGLVLLNKFPYANGHLLVALGAARPTLLAYSPDERAAFWSLVDRAVGLCRRTLEPQGVNIGVNEGRAAGAGVPTHLHAHVVPRWHGDTNFITVVGEVRVAPDSLEAMAEAYRRTVAERR
ncbi:MAG: HIT domain-containing protein [Phycisphaerales bacterium]